MQKGAAVPPQHALPSSPPSPSTPLPPSHTFAFATLVGGLSLAAGAAAMAGTGRNTEDLEAVLAARKTRSVDAALLASANKARLAVLLEEAHTKKGGGRGGAGGSGGPGDGDTSDTTSEARYRAALRGESMGTHSRGTTVGAAAINSKGKS